MARKIWVLLDFVLAAVFAIIGNIVASYLQDTLQLAAPARFGFVAVLFAVCFVLLLMITLKRAQAVAPDSVPDRSNIEVRGKFDQITKGADVTGMAAEEIPNATTVQVNLDAKKVSGKLTGLRLGSSDDTGTGQAKPDE